MIIDNLKNAQLYYGLSNRMHNALKFLKENDFSSMDCGKYEIEGSDVYALIFNYETKSPQNTVKEAHKRYIDIHYMADGNEGMGFAGIDSMKPAGEYNEKDDVVFFEGEMDYFKINQGMFAVCGPDEVHSPGNILNETSLVKKVVVKVKV